MTYSTASDPWSDQPQPVRRRRGWLIGVAVGALVVAIGVGVGIGLTLTGNHHQAAGDPEGQQACEIANNWNKSRPGFISGEIATAVHSHSVHSTHAELVTRGDALYDTWTTVEAQQIAGDLTPAERDLRALAPLIQFRTACLQAGYGG